MKNVNQIKMLNSINMQYRDKKCITDVTNRGGKSTKSNHLTINLTNKKMSNNDFLNHSACHFKLLSTIKRQHIHKQFNNLSDTL